MGLKKDMRRSTEGMETNKKEERIKEIQKECRTSSGKKKKKKRGSKKKGNKKSRK